MPAPIATPTPPIRTGFYYGWLMAAIAALTLAVVFGFRFVFSVAFVPLLQEFGWDRATTSGIVSLQIFTYGALVPFAGILVDRVGARAIIPIGVAIVTASVLLVSQAQELWQFYLVFGPIAAIGTAASGYIPNFVLVSTWFMRKRATAFGIALAGNGGSFVIASLGQLLIGAFGWRMALLSLAVVLGGGTLAATALLLRRRPEDVGQTVDGEPLTPAGQAGVQRGVLQVVDTAWAGRNWTAKSALRTLKFWCFFTANLTVWGIANSMLTQHHAAYAQDAGHSSATIAAMVALYGVTNVIGNLCGFLADRFGREPVYTVGCASIFVGLIVLLLATNPALPWLLLVYAVLFGFGFGIISPTATAAIADVFQGPNLGVINGLVVTSFGLGGSFSPWLAGWVFDHTGSYVPAFLFALSAVVVSAVLIWVARPSSVRAVRRQG